MANFLKLDTNLDKQPICIFCEATAVRSIEGQEFLFKDGESDVLLHAQIPVISCESCGECYVDEGAEEAQHEAVCAYLERLSPRDIVALRKQNGLSQAGLAKATNIGIASIKRWERGVNIQSAALDNQLRNLEQLIKRNLTPVWEPKFQTVLSERLIEEAKRFELRPSFKVEAEAA